MDFRAYLKSINSPALAYTGNDARIDPTKAGYETPYGSYQNTASGRERNTVQQYVNQLYDQYQQSQQPNVGAAIQAALAASRPATAPYLNINAIQAQAKANAQNTVNPLYSKYLNDYLQQEAAAKASRQAENEATVKNLQAQLANSLQGNELSRTATKENTAADLNNISNQEQAFQAESGLTNDINRANLLGNQGALTGSGLGQGQDLQAQQARNLKEGAQENQYQYSANQKQLLENQTFDQLANSDALSRLKETEGENTANFNLNDYLQQAAASENQFRISNEQQRQQALASQTKDLVSQQVANFLSSYKNNPSLYTAAYGAYGGLL